MQFSGSLVGLKNNNIQHQNNYNYRNKVNKISYINNSSPNCIKMSGEAELTNQIAEPYRKNCIQRLTQNTPS